MKIKTKYFDELEILSEDIITFENGIPGFEELHQYIIINQDEVNYSFLQSLENSEICFIIMPPALVVTDYDISISEDIINKLNIEKAEDVCVFGILNIPDNVKDMTINLKAPIVINIKNRKGAQEILDDDRYQIKYKIVKEADASC